MAQKVLVQLVDDLTGESSDDISTVLFGLDGASYEIDLTEDNAERLRSTLADYVAAARRTGGRIKRGNRPSNGGAANGEAGQVREWAQENGFELSARGRIPGHVLEAYKEAQTAEKAPKRRSRKKS
jgi:hypothetical protein